jgi:hypothetical protein
MSGMLCNPVDVMEEMCGNAFVAELNSAIPGGRNGYRTSQVSRLAAFSLCRRWKMNGEFA